MRLLRFSKWLVLGGAAVWLYRKQQQPARSLVRSDNARDDQEALSDLVADPDDPVQGLDEVAELRVTELAIDAMSRADAEAASDLAMLSSDLDERGGIDDEPVLVPSGANDVGELYGMHVQPAVDRDLPDDDAAFAAGENWVEHLAAASTEYGLEPEVDIDVDEDTEDLPLPTDHRDIPVADRGAAGPRGL